jgi:hypothetical protein
VRRRSGRSRVASGARLTCGCRKVGARHVTGLERQLAHMPSVVEGLGEYSGLDEYSLATRLPDGQRGRRRAVPVGGRDREGDGGLRGRFRGNSDDGQTRTSTGLRASRGRGSLDSRMSHREGDPHVGRGREPRGREQVESCDESCSTHWPLLLEQIWSSRPRQDALRCAEQSQTAPPYLRKSCFRRS